MSFEKRDYSLLSDLLEYELTNTLESWLGEVQKASSSKSIVVEETESSIAGEKSTTETTRSYEPIEQIQNPMGGR